MERRWPSMAVSYWRRGDAVQNFGDFLSELLYQELFVDMGPRTAEVWIVGSVIDDDFLAEIPDDGRMIVWGAGMRRVDGVRPQLRDRLDVLAVRGPATREQLGLDESIPVGDTALLLPLVYSPTPVERVVGRTVCVPHFHERRPDTVIRQLTGCDDVLRPNLDATRSALTEFIDRLCSYEFVLAGSLHAAIVAAAYGRPFAFWDSGVVDLPFKWSDFALSAGFESIFVGDLDAARQVYEQMIAPRISLPSMLPSLARAPFVLRSELVPDMPRRLRRASRRHTDAVAADLRSGPLHGGSLAGTGAQVRRWRSEETRDTDPTAVIEQVRSSGAFSPTWYLGSNPDVAAAGVDPVEHYVVHGAAEGRDPHPLFDTAFYVEQCANRGVHVTGNPLAHLLSGSGPEGVSPDPLFDAACYRSSPDGADVGRIPWLDHVTRSSSATSAMSAYPLFEPEWYLATNPDVRQAELDPLEHYVRSGRHEGRLPSPAVGVDGSLDGPFRHRGSDARVVVVVMGSVFRDLHRCLVSLVRRRSRTPFRTVLVTDLQPDALAELRRRHEGLDVVRQRDGETVVTGLTRAIAEVDAEYVVVVRSDLVATDGWLDPLVDLAERRESVAMVCGTVIDIDGTLVEAGVVLRPSGQIVQLGSGCSGADGRHRCVRDVDGAVLAPVLVRVGGPLDPGTRGDVALTTVLLDAALTAKDERRRVLVQPASTMQQLSSGSRVRPLIGRPEAEWLLHRHPLRERTPPHVLVIDDAVPQPDRHAGARATAAFLTTFARHGVDVTYWPHDPTRIEPYATELEQAGVHLELGNPDLRRWLRELDAELQAIVLARPQIANMYLDAAPDAGDARIVYFTHDLHALRERRRSLIEQTAESEAASREMAEIENRVLGRVDLVLTPSSAEVAHIEQIVPHIPVRVVPLQGYTSAELRATTPDPHLASRTSILFVGGFPHLPNVDAARFLVEEVMPLVWRRVPDADVVLAGSQPPAQVLALASERVRVTGWLADLGPVYGRARLSISPLRFGAGVKGKILESLRMGVPVVTTPIGNEGIDLEHGVEAMIGTTAAELADRVVELFEDPALLGRLARAGLSLLEDRHLDVHVRDALFEAVGIRYCTVCGVVERVLTGPHDHCSGCSATLADRAVAEALLAPYRSDERRCLLEAAPAFSGMRVHGLGCSPAIGGFFAGLATVSWSDANAGEFGLDTTRGPRRVDLFIGASAIDTGDRDGAVADIRRRLVPGGRWVFSLAETPVGTMAELERCGFRIRRHGGTSTGASAVECQA